jgi:hypothetical protein
LTFHAQVTTARLVGGAVLGVWGGRVCTSLFPRLEEPKG